MPDQPEIVKETLLAMQLCIPKDWDEEKIINFAEEKNTCGTTCGWVLQKNGDAPLKGDPERVKCSTKENFVHVLVVA